MSTIDPTARVAPGAVVGDGAAIGPYCVLGPDVVVGEGCRLVAHVHVTGHTTVGARTVIYPFASLGTPPQSVKYRGGATRLTIGTDCDIREGVSVNIGTEDDRGITEIGDHCFLMAGSHVAHDCKVGNHVTFANNVVLGGHVSVGDFTFLGGQAAVRQFVRIAEGAMIVGLSGIRADIIPWGMAQGRWRTSSGSMWSGSPAGICEGRYPAGPAGLPGAVFRRRRVSRPPGAGGGMVCGRPLRARLAFVRSGKRPLTAASRRAGGADEDA